MNHLFEFLEDCRAQKALHLVALTFGSDVGNQFEYAAKKLPSQAITCLKREKNIG